METQMPDRIFSEAVYQQVVEAMNTGRYYTAAAAREFIRQAAINASARDDKDVASIDAALTALQALPEVGEPPRGYAVAPKEIWLQLHGDCSDDELDKPVDYEGSADVTWCWHEIYRTDVRYVRADLATVSEKGAKE
jgi:hypothetical protein